MDGIVSRGPPRPQRGSALESGAMSTPSLREMFARLIPTPSVRSTNPALDCENERFVLAGHTDTVPCDPGLWRSDPFAATEREGRLCGLGSTDMKGFLAIVIEALRDLDPGRLRAHKGIFTTAIRVHGRSGHSSNPALGRNAPIAPAA